MLTMIRANGNSNSLDAQGLDTNRIASAQIYVCILHNPRLHYKCKYSDLWLA